MNNAASFDLLKFIERRPTLSAAKIIVTIILCAVILFGYFFFQVHQVQGAKTGSTDASLRIDQLSKALEPFFQEGANNPMVGVLSSKSLSGPQPFYPEFLALTHIHVNGLWLERVVIQRYPAFIKITGAMDSSEKLDQLLSQLAAQPAFKDVHFIGVDVNAGVLPQIPKKYQDEIKQLKLPSFYHFTIQTTPLKASGGSK